MTDSATAPLPEPDDEPGSDWVDPDLDPEAHMLCATMWSHDVDELRFVTSLVREDDFADPFHRPIYAAIRDAVAGGRPHDPVSISAELSRAGTDRVPQAVHRTHRNVLTLGSSAGAVRHYAATVVAGAYRRSFHELAGKMQHAAEAAAEDELFPILVELGTRQRAELRRLTVLRHSAPDHTLSSPGRGAVEELAPRSFSSTRAAITTDPPTFATGTATTNKRPATVTDLFEPRKKPGKKPLNTYASASTAARLDWFVKQHGLKTTDVVDTALVRLLDEMGVPQADMHGVLLEN